MPINRLRTCRLPVTGSSKLRVAQLTAGCSFDSAELFLPRRWTRLQAWAPNALIGSAADLQRFVERFDLGTVDLDTLDHSIYVLTAVGDPPLTNVLRQVLWHRFGVPVFELYTDDSGLLAYECEAHEGWHTESDALFHTQERELVLRSSRDGVIRTGLVREIDSRPCSCGRPSARLVTTLELQSSVQPILAAIA